MIQTVTASQLTIEQEELATKIQAMNLEPVIFKLVYEYGWNLEKALLVEAQYKTFLFMTLTLSEAVVPTQEIDEMWHNHILDTRLYALHCKEVFGRFIDHFPYFGVRGGNDAQLLKESYKDTVQKFGKYAPIFGATLINLHGTEASQCVGSCAEHGCNSPSPSCCDGDIEANMAFAGGSGNDAQPCGSQPCLGCSNCDAPTSTGVKAMELYSIRPNIAMLG
jgi:hypothetical protein